MLAAQDLYSGIGTMSLSLVFSFQSNTSIPCWGVKAL